MVPENADDRFPAFPLLNAVYETASQNRTTRESRGGDRSKGLEELLNYLGLQHQRLADSNVIHGEILTRRSMQDFEMAAECLLNGMFSVALDCMRDVMEVEFLLRDFRYNPEHVERWLSGTEDDLRTFFAPGRLRERYATKIGVRPRDLRDSADYRIHSMMLHVGIEHPFFPRGLLREPDPIQGEFVMADVFEHGRRLVLQIEYLLGGEKAVDVASSEDFLPAVSRAWQSTQILSSMFRGLLIEALEKDEPINEG